MAERWAARHNLSYRAKLGIAIALNLGMGVGWAVAAALGGSSFLVAEAADSFGDAVSYGLSIFGEQKSPRIQGAINILKGSIGVLFGGAAIALGLVRFALKWAINPALGVGLAAAGLAINGACAYLLRNGEHEEDLENGDRVMRKSNWRHTLSDLYAGGINLGMGILDWTVGEWVPGLDLVGAAIAGTIQISQALKICKDGYKLWQSAKKPVQPAPQNEEVTLQPALVQQPALCQRCHEALTTLAAQQVHRSRRNLSYEGQTVRF